MSFRSWLGGRWGGCGGGREGGGGRGEEDGGREGREEGIESQLVEEGRL